MPKAIKKAAIYCRVSTLHQIDKDSLPMQRNDMINYAKYALNIEDYEVFEDAGYSGKNMDRPAFQAMMERVHDGEFTHILVWKIDRISRNLLDFANMYEQCKKLGITFISKNEQFDTSTAMGEAMLKIILVFAELERNMTSERVSATMNARAANKQWNGGRIAYGYDYDKETNTFSIRDDEAMVVHQIFDTYEELRSLQYTANALNTAGLKSRRGFSWSAHTCQIILTNPFYLGTLRYNYRDESQKSFSFKDKSEWILVPNHHIAIVSQEQFDRCQYWLKKNRRKDTIRHTQRKNVHIFAGLIHCGYCGELMTATLDRIRASGYQPSMYICGSKRSHKNCGNKYTHDPEVGGFVFQYISNMIHLKNSFTPIMKISEMQEILKNNIPGMNVKSASTISQLRYTLLEGLTGTVEYRYAQERLKNDSKSLAKEKAALQAEISKRQRALNRLEEFYLFSDSSLPRKDYLLKQNQLTNEITDYHDKLSKLQHDSIFTTTLSDEQFIYKASSLVFQKMMQKDAVDMEELATVVGNSALKDFINKIISNIIMSNGKVIEITFLNGLTHQFEYK